MIKELALVFFVSMVPILELRASIPMGIAMDLPAIQVWFVSMIGNMVPVPFLMLFVRRILEWMKTKEGLLNKIECFLEEKASKGAARFYSYTMLGLFIFVAIPLPGTGAWTGALVAAMLNLSIKNSVFTIFAGVVAASLIVLCVSAGVFAGVSAIF